MTLQIDFWQLVGLLSAGLGALWVVIKFAAAQAQRYQEAAHKQLIDRLTAIEQASKEEAGQWQRMEREMLQLKADLPLHYVRREDYIRGQSVIEAKLDALSSKLETHQLRTMAGGKNHDAN